MTPLSHLQVRNPKDDETPIEAATQIFSSLLTNATVSWWDSLWTKPTVYAFELFLLNQTLYYYITAPKESETFMQSLMASSYSSSATTRTTDPVDILFKAKHISIGEVALANPYYYPFKTYTDFANIDPMASVVGFLAKMDPNLKMGIQILITSPSFTWQDSAMALTQPKTTKDPVTGAEKSVAPTVNTSLIQRKIAFQGGKAVIRLIVATNNDQVPTGPYLQNLAGTFGGFSLGEGNRFGFATPSWSKPKLMKAIKERTVAFSERQRQILNAQELATIWHPPGKPLSGIKNIAWGKTLAGEPPENLPVADGISEDERRKINFFAKTEFKNKETIFGLKQADKRRHSYIIGKTGAGKSTLIANMAIDDIRKDHGVGIIDPHGDLCDTILEYIPKRRMNDVVYLEPFDMVRPFSLNVLEIKNPQHKHLVSSGIVGIFAKLYADSWGPRLEYILRNVILTLLDIPGSTLVDVLAILANPTYRKKAIAQVTDPVIKTFWEKEFEKMPDRMKAEAISPIQNKVGQFVSARMIRNIIGVPKSSVDLEDIMNSGKIMILNLSQGKLGEDNAALLGAMIITQIQLAAMQRAFLPEEERRDFMLYVDEFQNFATSSFIKILSEARKYRLCLNLTNQYIDQLDETIRYAIFGNVGTLVSFVMGANDAEIFSKEYGGLYTPSDLVSLGKHEVVMKLSIDNMMSSPFPAKTLALPALKNSNREKIMELSKEKYGRNLDADAISKPESFIEDPADTPPPQGGGGGGQGGPRRDGPRNDGPRRDDGAFRPGITPRSGSGGQGGAQGGQKPAPKPAPSASQPATPPQKQGGQPKQGAKQGQGQSQGRKEQQPKQGGQSSHAPTSSPPTQQSEPAHQPAAAPVPQSAPQQSVQGGAPPATTQGAPAVSPVQQSPER
jgi:hypothetical protein